MLRSMLRLGRSDVLAQSSEETRRRRLPRISDPADGLDEPLATGLIWP
jgi:hypothetical protein